MLKLNEDILIKRAGNYACYIKGKNYYKDNRVGDIRTTKNLDYFKAVVRGTQNYQVLVKFDPVGEVISSNCTCQAFNSYDGDCKHIIALLTSLMNQDLSKKRISKAEENSVKSIINFYRNTIEEGNIPVNIEWNYEFDLNTFDGIDNSSFLSMRIGEDKLYVVRNVKNFIEKIELGEDMEFGKNFTFLSNHHIFKEKDKELLNFIKLLYENSKINNNGYYRYESESVFKDKRVLLTPIALKRFFYLMKERSFNAEIMDIKFQDITIVEKEIPVTMQIKEDGKNLLVSLESQDSMRSLTSDGEYFFSGGIIYKLPESQRIKLLPLYNEITVNRKGTLKVSKELKESFISEVLPNIKNIISLDIDEAVRESIYNPELKCEILFDKTEYMITGKVKFHYGEIIINPFSSKANGGDDKKRILLRDMEKEIYILKLLEESEFKVTDGEIYMDEDDKIFDFIYGFAPKLQEVCEIYYTEDFRSIKLLDSSYYSGGIKLNEDLNMLQFDFEIKGIDTKELDNVFIALKKKEKYYRLKNGSYLPLGETELNDVARIVEYLNINKKDFELGNISIPMFRTMYLDKFLQEKRLTFIKKNINFKKLVSDINEPEDIEYKIPSNLENILRDYQKRGFKWLKTLSKYGFGGILADDMGLGKTLQVIAFLLSEKIEKGPWPSLIIVPTSLVYNWESEIMKFAPELKVLIITGNIAEREDLIKDVLDYDVVITSYPLMRNDVELYRDFIFRYCILDEAQYIKNYKSLNAKSVKNIRANNYFALTGTPMENSIIELWSIFDFLMPGYLLSSSGFMERFDKPISKDNNISVLKDLNNHIKPFILRRLKKEVLKELPDKIEQKIVIDMNTEQKEIYLAYLKAIKGDLEEEISKKGFGRSHIKILAGLTRLRQICCYPGLFIEDYKGGSSKLDSLEEILKDAIESGHRILLFSQFTSMLKIIKDMLYRNSIDYLYLDGSTPMVQRGELVNNFNAGTGQVFLISLKAGGTGLNLTGADMVIHFDPWWNPAVEDQATDRAHRIGQENVVQVIKLITKGTIEEKIFNLQERKKEMIDKVIKEGETFVSKLSEEDIRSLFEIGEH